ncbi:MAG: ADP-ribose pyrophosphatase, partial [Actinomycetia bacterium]|nr:ADP-ribose pyrophosphatase [Actinomycetes bacterium]
MAASESISEVTGALTRHTCDSARSGYTEPAAAPIAHWMGCRPPVLLTVRGRGVIVARVGRVSGHVVLPPSQYVASLARKRMAASALFRDEAGRVLLVEPTYKPVWDLPGGAVEAEESPHAACRREVREEL